jgi:hypothetical protein
MSGNLRFAARQIRAFADRSLSDEALSRILADGARDELVSAIKSGEAPNSFVKYVDGVEGADEYRVKPNGYILYDFNYMPDAISLAIEFLRARSPKGGRAPHMRDMFFLANQRTGELIEYGAINYAELDPQSSWFIGNAAPYNRKADVQFVGKERLRFRVPPEIYQDASDFINKTYGEVIRARRFYSIVFPGQYVLKQGRREGQRVESPALLIGPRR